MNLKPKAHFLQHYPQMIERFGPLVKTLRFEAKRNYFKTAIQCSKNRKNVCFTLAKRHQMLMYLHYQKSNLLLHDEPEAISIKEVPIEALEQPISEILRQNLDIYVSDLLLQAKAVVFEGQRYNVEEVVVVGFHDDEPLFGYIRSIWHFKSGIYDLCDLIIIIRFNPHYNSYEVLLSAVLDLVNLKNLFDFHPLGVYKINNTLLLPVHHSIRCKL